MKSRELHKLLKTTDAGGIVEKYMKGEIFLTQRQLQIVLDMKPEYEKGHGGVILGKSTRKPKKEE